MTYQIVVKGPFHVAADAAAKRVERFHSGKALRNQNGCLFVVEAEQGALAEWFAAETSTPYPAGALLFYGPAKPAGEQP